MLSFGVATPFVGVATNITTFEGSELNDVPRLFVAVTLKV
jgi:hypothetical protein